MKQNVLVLTLHVALLGIAFSQGSNLAGNYTALPQLPLNLTVDFETQNASVRPLMVCPSSGGGAVLRVPLSVDCKDSPSGTRHQVDIYKRNIKEYRVSASSVCVLRQSCLSVWLFFGGKSAVTTIKRQPTASTDLEEFLKTGSCNHPAKTGNICRYVWANTHLESRSSCVFRRGYVTAVHGEAAFSDLGDVTGCAYDSGFCKSASNCAVTWSPNKDTKKRFILHGRFDATLVKQHLIIDRLDLSLVLTRLIRSDGGCSRYETSEGFQACVYPSTQTQDHEHRTRHRRGVEDAVIALQQEVGARLQYLLDRVSGPLSLVSYTCGLTKIESRLTTALAHSNPTMYARALLQEDLIHAAVSGDYMMIWPCRNVSKVIWMNDTECFAGLKVNYTDSDGLNHTGFLDPNTRIISKRSLPVPCGLGPTELVHIDGAVYKWEHGLLPVQVTNSVRTVPALYNRSSIDLEELSSTWVYGKTDFERVDRATAILHHMNDRVEQMESRILSSDTDRDSYLATFGLHLSWAGILPLLWKIMTFVGSATAIWFHLCTCRCRKRHKPDAEYIAATRAIGPR